MKRISAVVMLIFILNFTSICFAEYTAIDNTYVPRDRNYSTREEAVSEFVKAAGADVLKADKKILTQFKDYGKIAGVYSDAVAAAVEQGMVSGYEDGYFRPQAAISRAEAFVILNRILETRSLPVKYSKSFSDMPDWAKKDIDRLSAAGIVKGYGDGRFGAEDLLTSEQTAILAERAARLTGPTGDYYEYVNDGWLRKTMIPKDRITWSDISEISAATMKQIGEIVYSLNRRKYREHEEFEEGTSEQKIADVFAAAGNTAYRDDIGRKPIAEFLNEIDVADNMYTLLKVMADLEKSGFRGLISPRISTDLNNSSKYTIVFSECYTGIEPIQAHGDDRNLYKSAYKKYISRLFELNGADRKTSEERAAAVSELCLELAKASNSSTVDTRKTYNPSERRRIFTKIDSDKFLKQFGFPTDCSAVINDIAAAEKANSIWNQQNIGLIKDYLRASVLDNTAMYLDSETFLIWRDYKDEISGTKSGALPADYAVSVTEELLGWDLAKLYTEKYASQEDKVEVEKITNKIVFAYRRLLEETPWLSDNTKKIATKKITKMKIRVGYPDDIDKYADKDYKIRGMRDGGNLVEYRVQYSKRYFEAAAQHLNSGTEAGKDVWNMLPQTVNAMYEPTSNSITIPAGMIRYPLYDKGASFETNLGGIGTVIAHEVSHALDSSGARFDEDGNFRNWWNERDKNAFDGICREVEREYGKIEILPGEYIDGKATLAENLADIAGMECILETAGKNNPRIGDIFKSYAKIWRSKSNEAYTRIQLKYDNHSPDKVRVNRVLSNFEEFDDFYGVRPDDLMYLPIEERIRIWR